MIDEYGREWVEVDEVTGKPKNNKDDEEKPSIWGEIGCLSAVIVFFIGLIVLLVFANRASLTRSIKSFESHVNNGLDRTFTVYDYNGNKVFEDSGKMDYVYQDGKWYYDKDGKRTSTSGGIVIVQEK